MYHSSRDGVTELGGSGEVVCWTSVGPKRDPVTPITRLFNMVRARLTADETSTQTHAAVRVAVSLHTSASRSSYTLSLSLSHPTPVAAPSLPPPSLFTPRRVLHPPVVPALFTRESGATHTK
jgi:hypothetical protein